MPTLKTAARTFIVFNMLAESVLVTLKRLFVLLIFTYRLLSRACWLAWKLYQVYIA